MCWDGDVLMGIDTLGGDAEAKELLHYVLPEEGFCLWTDGMGIPVGNNSRYGAHLFMDWLMDPKIAGKNANWVWYLSRDHPGVVGVHRPVRAHAGAHRRAARGLGGVQRRRRVRDRVLGRLAAGQERLTRTSA